MNQKIHAPTQRQVVNGMAAGMAALEPARFPLSAIDLRGGGREAERRGAPPAPALPCLSVTTALEQKQQAPKPLPGPRRKQADALTRNIEWLARTFGKERIGFLTLTLGDLCAGGRYRNLRDRREAQRRFHSLQTNVIARRYQCGVTITERHANGGLHFHLAVLCAADIRGQMDFAACFPPKDARGKPTYPPDYSSANAAIKCEWAFWRRIAKEYGFGRHQLQPMRENGEALGRYLGAYLRKDWEHRLPDDKGARCVRYFGHWSRSPKGNGQRPAVPPYGSRFGWMTPRAQAWRELIKQVVIVARHEGTHLAEENIKDLVGPKWAWKLAKLFRVTRFEVGEWQAEAVQLAILEHNLNVQTEWRKAGGNPARSCWWHVTEVTMDHLRPSLAWQKQMAELELAKQCEAEIRRRLKALAKKKAAQAEQRKMVKEVADELQGARKGGQR